jgi:hypothetical protein
VGASATPAGTSGANEKLGAVAFYSIRPSDSTTNTYTLTFGLGAEDIQTFWTGGGAVNLEWKPYVTAKLPYYFNAGAIVPAPKYAEVAWTDNLSLTHTLVVRTFEHVHIASSASPKTYDFATAAVLIRGCDDFEMFYYRPLPGLNLSTANFALLLEQARRSPYS